MSLFSSISAATGTGSSTGQFNFVSFLPMVVIFVLFWILLIRPQQKKAKEHNKMLSALQAGDEVIATNGILGKIVKIDEQFIQLEVATNVTISLQKSTVANKVEKGIYTKARA